MLRQVFVLKDARIIYRRDFANALTDDEVIEIDVKIREMTSRKLGKELGHFNFFKYKVSYELDKESSLLFLFITGLVDDYFRSIRIEVENFKELFLEFFPLIEEDTSLDNEKIIKLNNYVDQVHRNLKPKISIVGFSGVGKTTIKKLIKLDEIPLEHIPTISGDIATIKIGNLFFNLFDFAGQDQFRYLWKSFIKGSDSVLIVTDSTPKNIETSKFFLELIEKEVPYARTAIIANKQDLPGAMSPEEIEEILNLRTYPMIANRAENREKMIQIIADILDINFNSSHLLDSAVDKDKVSLDIEKYLGRASFHVDTSHFKKKTEDEAIIDEVDRDEQKVVPQDKEFIIASKDLDKIFLENEQDINEHPEFNLEAYVRDTRKRIKQDIEEYNKKERLLGIIKAKKKVKIEYIERYIKIPPEKIVGFIFDLIGAGKIEGEFNEDDTEFTLKTE
ncbi:MAG: ADP-ribosylation factor-like protein [Promethearchaeota archaeon]